MGGHGLAEQSVGLGYQWAGAQAREDVAGGGKIAVDTAPEREPAPPDAEQCQPTLEHEAEVRPTLCGLSVQLCCLFDPSLCLSQRGAGGQEAVPMASESGLLPDKALGQV